MSPEPVLLLGVPSEPPLRMVADELERLGVPHLLWNQLDVDTTEVELSVVDGRAEGRLHVAGETWSLEDFGGVFVRLADAGEQPGLKGLPAHDPRRVHADEVADQLLAWCELAPGRVVNRLRPMATNASKPYQLTLIHGVLTTPETLVTSDPDLVLAFLQAHGRVVYKSTSGARSVVQELEQDDLVRLGALSHCPVQFQEYVEGVDVRVHALADGTVFATAIDSATVDYRYAHRTGEPATMHAVRLPDDVASACLLLAARLGLALAGIDLRITPDGAVYCLEVNPSPAYSAYESEDGQPIARALARYLCGLPRTGRL